MDFNSLKQSRVVLSKQQMQTVKGGFGTCGYKNANGSSGCGLSKAQAQFI